MRHVWRPLYVVAAIVGAILVVRMFVVPRTFGIGQRGYMYAYRDKAAETWWANFKVKYRGRQYCRNCHADNYKLIMASPHAIIQCEDCHGPAADHPEHPAKLEIIKSRLLCLRCHAKLPYPTSQRDDIPGFLDPNEHNPGMPCVTCHNPHSPVLG